MRSLILIASYLWKDTWKRWFEQPGSLLARVVVTSIMVSISVVLIVAFAMQVEKLRAQMKTFGLDNILIIETVSRADLEKGAVPNRFSHIRKWGDLLEVKKLLVRGNTSEGDRLAVVSYDDDSIVNLRHYLQDGHSEIMLTKKYPEGMLIDVEVEGEWIRVVCLPPRDHEAKLLQGDTLLIPSSKYAYFEKNGYAVTYFLTRFPDAPSIEEIDKIIKLVDSVDKKGRVDTRSSARLKKKLENLEKQQALMRNFISALLGGALALIYGTLSILEFAQQRYVSALMRSFGVPRSMLALRNVLESLLIVNSVSLGMIYALMQLHDKIFKALKLQNPNGDLVELYFSNEVILVIIFVNIGVLLSSLPVIKAMSKPVGKVLS